MRGTNFAGPPTSGGNIPVVIRIFTFYLFFLKSIMFSTIKSIFFVGFIPVNSIILFISGVRLLGSSKAFPKTSS